MRGGASEIDAARDGTREILLFILLNTKYEGKI